ncbi:hypothetical protein [Actinokineospora cianjurensis]|uniref:Uncharacterized protein n=1 Tax=Actinokineospora cianjurensis TaxID=585224 RepID=A0A421B6D6_9PSEU|nr:hypothetical protein [Actinokineospora cianjurensis]RLK59957.1 hypothetical protein CLV68_0448 [Actinokineospora cianjurensis]
MTTEQVLLLLLVTAVATVVAVVAGFVARLEGKSIATCLTIAGGAWATTVLVAYTVIGSYR